MPKCDFTVQTTFVKVQSLDDKSPIHRPTSIYETLIEVIIPLIESSTSSLLYLFLAPKLLFALFSMGIRRAMIYLVS